MTAPVLNKEWEKTQEETNNWFMLNNFEKVIQKYDNKETGWLWWKKKYSDYFANESETNDYVTNIETQIENVKNMSWWKKPIFSWLLNIKTKQKILGYYYSKKLLVTSKSYFLNTTHENFVNVNQLLTKIENNTILKNIGKHLSNFKSIFSYFINKTPKAIKQEIDLNNNSNRNNENPRKTLANLMSPSNLLRRLYTNVDNILSQLEPENIISILTNEGILSQESISELKHSEISWQLMPLLHSNNNFIREYTIFFILLNLSKSYLHNADDILENALKFSTNIRLLPKQNMLSTLKTLFSDVTGKTLIPALLHYYPAKIKSVTLNYDGLFLSDQLLSMLPDSVTHLKISFSDTFKKELRAIVTAMIIEDIPKNITHLDLSGIGFTQSDYSFQFFSNMPTSVKNLNFSDNKLSSLDNTTLIEIFNNRLPKHLLGVTLSENDITVENKKRLQELTGSVKRKVNQNINLLSLKSIVANFIWNNMNASYDNKTRILQITQNNKVVNKIVPQEIGDAIEQCKSHGVTI